jgi:hypothetical protein
VERLTRRYDNLESRIVAASPKYADQTQPHILSAQELQGQLDGETLLLEYSLGRERSYVWAVTGSSIQGYELPPRARIERETRNVGRLVVARAERRPRETDDQWRARVRRADLDYWRAAATLSEMLLAPLTSHPDAKRLVIVPQGALQSVPFGALPIPSATSDTTQAEVARSARLQENKPATPLILDHEVVILPSASTLALLRRDWPDRKTPAKNGCHSRRSCIFGE